MKNHLTPIPCSRYMCRIRYIHCMHCNSCTTFISIITNYILFLNVWHFCIPNRGTNLHQYCLHLQTKRNNSFQYYFLNCFGYRTNLFCTQFPGFSSLVLHHSKKINDWSFQCTDLTSNIFTWLEICIKQPRIRPSYVHEVCVVPLITRFIFKHVSDNGFEVISTSPYTRSLQNVQSPPFLSCHKTMSSFTTSEIVGGKISKRVPFFVLSNYVGIRYSLFNLIHNCLLDIKFTKTKFWWNLHYHVGKRVRIYNIFTQMFFLRGNKYFPVKIGTRAVLSGFSINRIFLTIIPPDVFYFLKWTIINGTPSSFSDPCWLTPM